MKRKINLIPNKSVAQFEFGEKIEKYFHLKYSLIPKQSDQEYAADIYTFFNSHLSIYVDNDNKIETIVCEKECFLENVNLIGLNIDKFQLQFNIVANKIEKIYMSYLDLNRTETVYEFIHLGLQIWTYRKKIFSITCIKDEY